MKSRICTWIAAISLFGALAMPALLVAQEEQFHKAHQLRHYTVVDLGTLGGTFSIAYGINDRGQVDGFATVPGDGLTHAFVWKNGPLVDLGTLGGPNSQSFAGPSEALQAAGLAETSMSDQIGRAS